MVSLWATTLTFYKMQVEGERKATIWDKNDVRVDVCENKGQKERKRE